MRAFSTYSDNNDPDAMTGHAMQMEEQPEAGPSDWWRRLRQYGSRTRHAGKGSRKAVFVDLMDDGGSVPERGEVDGFAEAEEEGDAGGISGEDVGLGFAFRGRRICAGDAGIKPIPPRVGKRQGSTGTATLGSTTLPSATTSTTSTAPLFVPPPSTLSTTTNPSTSSSLATISSVSSSTSSSSSISTSTRPYSYSGSSRTFTSLWSTTRTTPSASASPTFVPGVTFNLTLAGTRDDEAIYAVEVQMGHGSDLALAQNAYAWRMAEGEEDNNGDQDSHGAAENVRSGGADRSMSASRSADTGVGRGGRGKRKRQSDDLSDGYQTVKLQVDLGSSDMWVAITDCTTTDCRSAPALFDPSDSISSGVRGNMTYHSGSVSGTIMWEEVQLDKFAIAYQAFIAGDRVLNENLGGGDFSGVLGMALPANSIISSQIPGTTTNNPDGATFLDNLFSSGTYAPTQRIFSLALERREDVRTRSLLTIGSVYPRYCPEPCSPSYIPIVANPRLGTIGYLHWRIPLMGISATTWSDPQRGVGATQQSIPLGPSIVVPTRGQPLAVLDSGGVAVLVGHKPYADALYGAYGISASSDGYYRMSCKTQLAFNFNFGGQWFSAHPLDMSWSDPTDPSQTTCIGAIQYAPTLGEAGDFVFGSSFLKNAYTIFSYPDQSRTGLWQPAVGLIGLTNASIASQDFYAVRALRQSLAQVSANGPFIGDSSSPASPSASPSAGTSGGGSVVNTTAIVAGSVVGFFVLAAVAFCAWWFFLKRKYGTAGYPLRRNRAEGGGGGGTGTETPESESAAKFSVLGGSISSSRRNKKHAEVHRQKSMMEGYSDYEGDSWTEGGGGDSIRLGYLPEVLEEANHTGTGMGMGRRGSSIGSSLLAAAVIGRQSEAEEEKDQQLKADREDSTDGFGTGRRSAASDAWSKPRSLSRPRNVDTGIAMARPDFSLAPELISPTSPTTLDPAAALLSTQAAASTSTTSTSTNQASRGRSREPLPPSTGHNARSMSLSMSGPFPVAPAARGNSGGGGGQRGMSRDLMGLDVGSPMYEINAGDYFVAEGGRRGSRGGGNGSRSRER